MANHTFTINNGSAQHDASGLQVAAFEVTGVDTNNKRFKQSYGGSRSGFMAMNGINLYRGTKWARLENGKRIKLNEVYN